MLLFFSGCGKTVRLPDQSLPPATSLPEQSGLKINVFFSQTSGSYHNGGGIDDLLIESIDNAKQELLIAIYALTNDRIRDAIVRAFERGVRVQLYTDDGALFSDDIKYLSQKGIIVKSDEDPNALMHSKFTVIDNQIVWTGSCNYTYYAFYRNNENLIKITGTKIADVYREEFQEMWNNTLLTNPYRSETIEVYFSPEDDFKTRLLELIANAKKEIRFLAFAFTDEEVARTLVRKHQEGLIVQGVFDEKQNGYQKSSQYTYLKQNGIDVRLDGNKFTLHDKVMIIDDTVVTGSYNFTQKANEINNENVVVVHNEAFKRRFMEEFSKIYAEAKP